MSDIQQVNGKTISLGETYWDAALRLVEKCNKNNVEIPRIEIPLFSGLILAEGGLYDDLAELDAEARSSVLVSIKELLDIFLLVEKKL
jgi:hypothetical protein